MRSVLDVSDPIDLVALEADAFDAVLCVLAGIDAASGEALPPAESAPASDRATVEREGWIWVRR